MLVDILNFMQAWKFSMKTKVDRGGGEGSFVRRVDCHKPEILWPAKGSGAAVVHPPLTGKEVLVSGYPICGIDRRPVMNNAPILSPPGLFLCYVHHGKITRHFILSETHNLLPQLIRKQANCTTEHVFDNTHPDTMIYKHFSVGDLRAIIQCNEKAFHHDSFDQGNSAMKSIENIQETGLSVSTIPFEWLPS